jgi:excisionase family DNA binding protein
MSLSTVERELIAHSIEDFCDLTSPSRAGVYNMIKAGKIKAAKVGRRTIIPRAEALAWLARVTGENTDAA